MNSIERHKKSLLRIPACLLMLLLVLPALPSPASSAPLVQVPEDDKEIQALVLTDRPAVRMEPELFHAFRSAALTAGTPKDIDYFFTVFNPRPHDTFLYDHVEKAVESVRRDLSPAATVTADLRKSLKPGDSLFEAVDRYADAHPDSSVGKLRQTIRDIMSNYDFLLIEPTFTTVVHPMFYNPDVTEVNTGYADSADVEDTLYGLFFIQAALDLDKPVFGSCHGAQLGWLLAGGGLTRVFGADEDAPNAYYTRRNPYTEEIEIWWMDSMLNSHDPVRQDDSGTAVYPLPEPFADRTGKYIRKDFSHTLAMTTPIPPDATVLSHHPLSMFKDQVELETAGPVPGFPMVTDAARRDFKARLKNIVIVDAFRYKTMFGFQFHPQEDVEDFNAQAVFEYLTRFVDTLTPSAR